ncbi:MAG: hypothetical protein HWN65_01140 [Candidatus Helarchaeota archaeon]|nr:hypothetical protein [Candidatus Helarchaeota archaeon]
MGESRGEGGSWLYGIILVLAGGFIVITGILNLAGFNPILDWLPVDLKYLAGVSGYVEMAIGTWGIVGGVGLIKDQEWGWGISLVVLSLVIVKYLSDVIAGIMALDWNNINLWLKLVAVIIAAVGMVYLGLTKYKYA